MPASRLRLTPRQARTALDLLTGAVVVSVAFALAGLTWRIAGHAGTGAVTVPSGRSLPTATVDIAPALALAPFGKSALNESGQATTLPLQLKGVVAANPASLSVAWISVGTEPAGAYRVGDSVSGGRIEAVLRDRVLIANNGRTEFLAFPDPTLTAAQREAAAGGTAGQPATAAAPPPTAPPGVAPALANNTATLLTKFNATPVEGGYRIGANAPPGLQTGDVLQSVNGTPLTDLTGAGSAYNAALARGSAQIVVLRSGKPMTLTVALR